MSEHKEPIPSMVYNAAIGGHVTTSQQIIDENENKEQSQINSEVKQALGKGGSVDERIGAAVNVEKTRAEEAESALDGRVDTLKEAVGTGGSVDERIAEEGAKHYLKEETYNKSELNNMITTPNQEYVSVTATAQTTAVTDVLPATGAADTTYRVGNWDGTQYNDSVFSEYAWNGSTYIKLSTKSQIGEVYDISANHADTKYADLAAALGTNGANIPQSLRKGGMSVKFVQSSDNNYVQFRCKTQSFSTNPEDWYFEGDDTLVENPEYLRAVTDGAGHLLGWIRKSDGGIDWAIGVPTPVKEYITEHLAEIIADITEGLATKVDKEEGKSLIDVEYANGVHYIENPEFVEVKVDNEDRILEAIMKDGTKILPAGAKVIGTAEYDGATIKTVENLEFAGVWLDGEDKILFGVEQDGNFLFGCGVPRQVKEYIEQKIEELSLDEYESIVAFIGDYLNNTTLEELLSKKVDGEYVENPEFVEVITDSEDKVLEGIQKDGTKVIGGDLKVLGNMEVSGVSYKVVENSEYLAAWIDAEDKVIFGFKTDGKTYVGDADFLDDVENIKAFLANFNDKNIDWDALTSFNDIENQEFIDVELDADDKILGGRKVDGTKFENNDVELNGNATVGGSLEVDGVVIKNSEDPENRSEITLDSEDRIISYRKDDGTLVENAGIETNSLRLTEEGQSILKEELNDTPTNKKWYQPKFGYVNILSEEFYLDKNSNYSDRNGVVLIQILEDNSTNARKRETLSYFYVKDSSLTGYGSDGNNYSGDLVSYVNKKYYVTSTLEHGEITSSSIEVIFNNNSVSNTSIQLELHAGKDVKVVGNKYFAVNIYVPYGTTTTLYAKVKATKVIDQETSEIIGYEYEGRSTEVTKIVDDVPYKAWKVTKEIEHYCIANVNFETFYKKNRIAVGIKYQGNSTTASKKRGFRLTFYKNNTYAKKEKVKIGEWVRLSGYNMKAYYTHDARIKDPFLSYLFMEIWESRGKSCYPWNDNSVIYNGATGMIKSFPIELSFGEEFYGLQFFGYKKDEKNYMLDGDDDTSGIFASGEYDCSWTIDEQYYTSNSWTDEMCVKGRELSVPTNDESLSVESAAAVNEFHRHLRGFITGTIIEDGESVEYTKEMLEEHIDIASWIDYYICLQIFQMFDNTRHNLMLYSGRDKRKFYPFFYDLDYTLNIPGYNTDTFEWAENNNPDRDESLWKKIGEEYKDSIINRYAELRRTVLSDSNMKSIYISYIKNIPNSIIRKEIKRWGDGNPNNFVNIYDLIKKRLNWLDNTLFNL